MAVMRSRDGKDAVLDCSCGCDEGIRIRIDKLDDDAYCILSYTNGSFYRDQGEGVFRVLAKKLRKIRRIITNRDYIYSEICMTKKDLREFKEFLDEID